MTVMTIAAGKRLPISVEIAVGVDMERFHAGLKRTLDLLGAFLGLAVLSPVLVLIAVAVKLDSPGPVLFRQTRVGLHGRHFRMLKFRSMVAGADRMAGRLRPLNETGGILFKMSRDPRVTRVGRFLRRTSLDELPQLMNVLKGEMSLVGPRPAVPEEVARYTRRMRLRLGVPPGLTGLWQVGGRSTLPCRRGMALDVVYAGKRSLALDLAILVMTVPAVVSGRGAW